jgi:hypothetical protein
MSFKRGHDWNPLHLWIKELEERCDIPAVERLVDAACNSDVLLRNTLSPSPQNGFSWVACDEAKFVLGF